MLLLACLFTEKGYSKLNYSSTFTVLDFKILKTAGLSALITFIGTCFFFIIGSYSRYGLEDIDQILSD